MNNWETMKTKRIIFDLFDYARILWNDFYRLDRDFNEEDVKRLKELIKLIEHDTKEIKEMIENVL
jgi:hypothetical protein